MQLPYSETPDLSYLGKIFENISECEKFFWFQAILTKLEEGKTVLSLGELADEMIADAWYMVSEYHLNLGPREHLERLIRHMQETTQWEPSVSKPVILEYLKESKDKEILTYKKKLTDYVPYRFQMPLMPKVRSGHLDGNASQKIEVINEQPNLMYYFQESEGADITIELRDEWVQALKQNYMFLQGWLQYQMTRCMQRRNPQVPGIAEKLFPPKEWNRKRITQYWKTIISLDPLQEIYDNQILTPENFAMDHFVPWSYVAHDEFWNLHPTTQEILNSKGNRLPDWDTYFKSFANLHYEAYRKMWRYPAVKSEFEKCAKEYISSDEVLYRLYRREGVGKAEFSAILYDVLRPVYDAAVKNGFEKWNYEKTE